MEEPTARRAIPGAGGGRSTVDTADRDYIERDERRWFGRREAPPHSSRGVDHSLLQRVEVVSFPDPHDQFTVEHAVDAQLGFESGLAADNSDAKAVPHFKLVAGFRWHAMRLGQLFDRSSQLQPNGPGEFGRQVAHGHSVTPDRRRSPAQARDNAETSIDGIEMGETVCDELSLLRQCGANKGARLAKVAAKYGAYQVMSEGRSGQRFERSEYVLQRDSENRLRGVVTDKR